MNVRWLKQVFSATAFGSMTLASLIASAGDHRMFRDEPQRPHVSAACQPNWGFNQTCWQRFPPVAPCPGQGDCLNGQCGMNSVYAPQSIQHQPQMFPTQSVAPMYSAPSVGHEYGGPVMGQPAPMPAAEHFPAPMPEPSFLTPHPSSIVQPPIQNAPPAGPVFEAPAGAPALPPLPAPLPAGDLPQTPVPAVPNQSRMRSGRPDYRTQGTQMAPVAQMPTSGQQNRYGNRVTSTPMPAPATNTAARYSNVSRPVPQQTPLTAAVVNNNMTKPAPSTAAPSNVAPPKPTMRYASGSSKPPAMPASSSRYLKQVR